MPLPYCSDCGEARVNHPLYKASKITDTLIIRLTSFFSKFNKFFSNKRQHHFKSVFNVGIFKLLSFLRMGRLVDRWEEGDSIRTKALFDGAYSRGVILLHFKLFNLSRDDFFVAVKGDKSLSFDVMPRPDFWRSRSLSWMDDKGILKKELIKKSIPTAGGGVARTLSQAKNIFKKYKAPFITKPNLGSRGRHTVIGIQDEKELEKAFNSTKVLTPWVVVEEELQGTIYRVTMIGGKVVAVARRDAPGVLGDGIHSVKELLDEENSDPRRDDFRFFKIQANDRADYELSRQNLTWDSIPEKGQYIVLNDKISRLHGTVIVDETDVVHPDNISLFEGPIHEVLNDPLVGIDFMIGDISKSWKEQERCGLVECNAMPYIDLHHYPYEGKARNPAGDLWDLIFSKS